MGRYDYQDEERRAMQMLAGSIVATLLALFIGMALAFIPEASGAELKPYVSLQAGAARLNGPGTETHLDEDCNPSDHPYHISNGTGLLRLSAGVRKGIWGLEIGYTPRAGGYQRSLEYGDTGEDYVGEIVDISMLDTRLSLHSPEKYGLSAYGFGSLGLARYKRQVWEGHTELPGGVVQWNYVNGNDADVWAQWKGSTGYELSYGLGAGVEYRMSRRWSMTAEYSATFGEFHTQALAAGIRFGF